MKANNKPSEQYNKESVLRVHLLPTFGALPLDRIGRQDIEKYKAKAHANGLSNKTINNHLAVLGKCLACAEEWGLLERAPRMRLLRTTPPPVQVLTDQECERLLAEDTEPMWNAMVLVALRTGMRLSELIGLLWSDVDFAGEAITIQHSIVRGWRSSPKNHRVRMVPMDEDVHRVLRPRVGALDGLVFHGGDGQPLTYGRAWKAMNRMCQRAGIRRLTWHRLRHTFATQLCQGRTPIRDVQSLLGHSSLTMTQRYTHVRQENLVAAVQCLRERQPLVHRGQQVGNEPAHSTIPLVVKVEQRSQEYAKRLPEQPSMVW